MSEPAPQYFFPNLYEFLKVLALLSRDAFWVHKSREGYRTRVGPHGDMSPLTFVAYKMFGKVIPTANWRQAAVLIGLPMEIAEQLEDPDTQTDEQLMRATGLTGSANTTGASTRPLRPVPTPA